jgi:DNA-binding CsgD family transcriptional regulator
LNETDGHPLSQRELEILQLYADGLSRRQIGERLGISEATVRTHSGRVLIKLRVHSQAAAVALGIRNGIVT